MKNSRLLLVIIVVHFCITKNSNAQTQNQIFKGIIAENNKQAKTLIRSLNDLKSGNWQDILTSFFQLGLKDLASDKRTLEFKANLFALKAKADTTLLIDTNYVKQKFSKNFQFDFGLKLDSQYRFSGAKAGFTLALINRRDSSLLSLIKTPADTAFTLSIDSLSTAMNRFRFSLRNKETGFFKSASDSLLFLKAKNRLDELMENGVDMGQATAFPKEFIQFASFDIIQQNFSKFQALYNEELRKLRNRPLLTLSVNGAFMKNEGMLNGGRAEMVYLQGLTKKGRNLELDLRTNIEIADTSKVSNLKNRVEFGANGGCNWAIITAAGNVNKSLVEFKPSFEYRSILQGLMPGEEKVQFFTNAEIRIRIMDNFWIPLTLKYDIKNSNVLGFLRVAFNMNAFKKSVQ